MVVVVVVGCRRHRACGPGAVVVVIVVGGDVCCCVRVTLCLVYIVTTLPVVVDRHLAKRLRNSEY
jgi:hypothetical protein